MITKDQTKKVSIIVVVYNGMAHIEECVSSVLAQTYHNFEVIIIDNCSTDGSPEYVRSHFPNLVVVASDENLGYGGGINKGLEYASGEYVVPLNQDTTVDKDWLAYMVRFLNEHPGTGAVCPRSMMYEDRTIISALGADIHISGFGYSRAKYQKDGTRDYAPIKVNGVSGSAYMIRKEILYRMGAIEECFGGMDDVVLSWMLNLMDYDMYCAPDSILYHKHQIELTSEKLFYLERDRLAMLFGTLKPYTLALYMPFFIMVELMVMAYCIMRGRAYVYAKARVWRQIISNINHLGERRKQTHRLRNISDFTLFRRLTFFPDWHQLARATK